MRRPAPQRSALVGAILLGIGLLCGRLVSCQRFAVSHSTKTFARDCVGRETEKLFVLTFDDGPWEYTEAIMEELAEKGAPATFFIIGRIFVDFPSQTEEYKALIRRMIREGHVVANHGMDNEEFTLDDVDACHSKIKNITEGHDMQYFRPAQGAYTIDKYQQLIDRGYKMVMWNLDPQDWRDEKDPETIMEEVRKAVRDPTGQTLVSDTANYGLPRRGSYIMLGHDNHAQMLQPVEGGQTLLATIIDEARDAGYRIVSLHECLGVDIPGSGNYCGTDFSDAQRCGAGECPSGVDAECPAGTRCYGSVLCGSSSDEPSDSSDFEGTNGNGKDDDWDWERLQNSSGPSARVGFAVLSVLAACSLMHLF